MVIKGCKSIAEFYIRDWMAENEFVNGYFTLEMNGNKAVIRDRDGDTLNLIYDSVEKCVQVDK